MNWGDRGSLPIANPYRKDCTAMQAVLKGLQLELSLSSQSHEGWMFRARVSRPSAAALFRLWPQPRFRPEQRGGRKRFGRTLIERGLDSAAGSGGLAPNSMAAAAMVRSWRLDTEAPHPSAITSHDILADLMGF